MDKAEEQVYFNPPSKMLVIDDSSLNRSFITSTFTLPNYDVVTAINGEQGIKLAEEKVPELILLDIMMPGMDGFEACKRLKKNSKTKDIPVIFITALDAIQEKLKAFDVGGADFVSKPFNHKELLARVKTNIAFRRALVKKEQALKFAMEERQHQAVVKIAAGVTHNFNNMLGVTFGNIMLVESLLTDNEDPIIKKSLKDVRTSLNRMQALVKKFLILTDRTSFDEDVTSKNNLHALVEEVVNNTGIHFSPKLKTNLIFNNNTDKNIFFKCNESYAREILYLIITEAIEITIAKPDITVSNSIEKNKVVISILINNFPISTEIINAIFEPFALPLTNVGTGLAFAVVKQLVEKNKGDIEAFSPGENMLQFNIKFLES